MSRYRIVFIAETEEDPSSILDFAQSVAGDLESALEGYDSPAKIDENDVSVEEETES